MVSLGMHVYPASVVLRYVLSIDLRRGQASFDNLDSSPPPTLDSSAYLNEALKVSAPPMVHLKSLLGSFISPNYAALEPFLSLLPLPAHLSLYAEMYI